MRTNVILNEALRVLIRLQEQGQVRELRGRLQWEGDLATLREGREHAYEITAEGSDAHAAG